MQRSLNRAVIAGLLLLSLLLFIPVSLRLATEAYTYDSTDTIPKAHAALVLGASVARGKLSPILEERARTAVELYNAGKVSKILVTGDNSVLSHDEVTPVRKFLLAEGIPAGDIFLDHAGFDTYSSMYRAREVFEAESVTIVTQDFHLPRAVFLARRLGLTAYGINPQSGMGSAKDYVRELAASVKALFDLAVNRKPKFLGEKIPLTGDGSTTWY